MIKDYFMCIHAICNMRNDVSFYDCKNAIEIIANRRHISYEEMANRVYDEMFTAKDDHVPSSFLREFEFLVIGDIVESVIHKL